MLNQYTRSEMHQIWCEKNRYQQWLNVELAFCSAQRQIGKIARSTEVSICNKAKFDIERIKELQGSGHDEFDAFVMSVRESICPEESVFIHFTASGADIKDTALSLISKEAGHLINDGLNKLLMALKELAIFQKDTVCVARVHGNHSEPTSFGLKILTHYDALKRARENFEKELVNFALAKFSGTSGAFAELEKEIEKIASENLGLKAAPIATQILGRDRHASLINHIAFIASLLEKLANEIRNLQRTEIAEVEEPFLVKTGQRNPLQHERKPWRCESVLGLAQIIRSFAQVALENISITHEADSRHEHAEQIILPDAFCMLDYMIFRMTQVMRGLVIYPQTMYRNLYTAGGIVFGSHVISRLIEKGLNRVLACELVDELARHAWESKANFKELLLNNGLVRDYLDEDQIEACFKTDYYLRNVDEVFRSVFGDDQPHQLSLTSFV